MPRLDENGDRVYEYRYAGKCRHCNDHKITRPRKLCKKCYRNPNIKNLYPVNPRYAKGCRTDLNKEEELKDRGNNTHRNGMIRDFNGREIMPEPTEIPIGLVVIGGVTDGLVKRISEERLAVMQERAKNGMSVTHKNDKGRR